MWLWYLELYIAVLLAFVVGAGVGVGGVRLLVRRTSGFSLGLDKSAAADQRGSAEATS